MATVAAIGLTAASLGLASPAVAAPTPSTPGSADDAVNQLEAEGYKVILNKVGDGPLRECTVTAIRPGRDVTHRVTVPGSDGTIEQLLYTTVYVDAKC
ncbi:hypothetical protein LRC484719_42770 [Mycobacterium riyadhense]|nr:PepSY domain-containing protein [Mycobacterium riyadhense]